MKPPKLKRPSNLSILLIVGQIVLAHMTNIMYYREDSRVMPPVLTSLGNLIAVLSLLLSQKKKEEKQTQDPFTTTVLQEIPQGLQPYQKPPGYEDIPQTIQPQEQTELPQQFTLSDSKFQANLAATS